MQQLYNTDKTTKKKELKWAQNKKKKYILT